MWTRICSKSPLSTGASMVVRLSLPRLPSNGYGGQQSSKLRIENYFRSTTSCKRSLSGATSTSCPARIMRDPLEEKTRDTAKTNKKAGTPRSGLQDLIPVKEAVEQRLGQMSRNVRTNVRGTTVWTFTSSLTRSNRPFLDPFFDSFVGFVVRGSCSCSVRALPPPVKWSWCAFCNSCHRTEK